jgi:hypothetical protein
MVRRRGSGVHAKWAMPVNARPGHRVVGVPGRSVMVATTYEFEVDGWISEQAREAFCDMTIEELPAGARLYGTVTDESHLLGIIAQFRSLGLVVVFAHEVAAGRRSPSS